MMKKVLKSAVLAGTSMLLAVTPVLADGSAETDEGYVDKLAQTVSNLVNWAAILAGLVALGFLVYAGIKYITSAGDPGKTEEAQKQIVSALIGLAIVVLSYAVVRVAAYLMGVGFGVNALTQFRLSGMMPTK